MAGRDLTAGPVGRHLAALTAPMTIGVFAVISIGLADAWFIGKIGGTELAAVGFIFPVTTALTSLGIGLAAGANASVSQRLGRKRRDEARVEAAHAMALGLLVGCIVALAGHTAIDPLFSLLQAQNDVMPSIRDYMSVWYLAFPLITVALVVNASIRAHGNTLVPALIMVVNALFNIGLDPILIFGWGPFPALGIAGAAWATLIAFAITWFVSAWPVFRRFDIARGRDFFRGNYRDSTRRIAGVGGPAALANAINPAGLSVVTAILAQFGPSTVAGFGAAGRIEAFVLVPLLSLSGSIGPIVGQNFGADRRDRAARAVRLAAGFCVLYGTAVAVALTTLAEPLAAQFSDEPAVREQTMLYLRIASWSFCAYGVLIVVNASLNARSSSIPSMLLSAARIGLLYVPLAWAGAKWFGEAGVYGGTLTANFIAAVAALVVAQRFDLFRLRRR